LPAHFSPPAALSPAVIATFAVVATVVVFVAAALAAEAALVKLRPPGDAGPDGAARQAEQARHQKIELATIIYFFLNYTGQ
jgi:hypothetical protein